MGRDCAACVGRAVRIGNIIVIVGRWSGTIGPNRVADFVGDYSTFLEMFGRLYIFVTLGHSLGNSLLYL